VSGSGTGTPAASAASATTVATVGTAPFVLERVTNPEIEPITLADMKAHLREFASVTARDDEITALIIGARQWVEDFTGRALVDQTWRITINGAWPIGRDANTVTPYNPNYSAVGWQWWNKKREILLRKSPALAITLFVSADAAGVETPVDPTAYAFCEPDSKWPRIVALNGGSWAGSTLKVEFRAGFANRLGSPAEGAEMIPVPLIQAMKLWAEAAYNRDKDTVELLLDVAKRLATPERCELGLA